MDKREKKGRMEERVSCTREKNASEKRNSPNMTLFNGILGVGVWNAYESKPQGKGIFDFF